MPKEKREYIPRKTTSRSTPVKNEEYRANLATGDEQATRHGGGIGIPGRRKWGAVSGYKPMRWLNPGLPELRTE